MQSTVVATVSLWDVIAIVLIPAAGVGFWILWRVISGAETLSAGALEAADGKLRQENERLWTQ
jgi:hypothetical protein